MLSSPCGSSSTARRKRRPLRKACSSVSVVSSAWQSNAKLPVIRDAGALREFLRKAPANILVRYRHDEGLSAGIRGRLHATAPASWPSFERLAAGMRMQAPTLRRRLQSEGQSYRSIKDEMRRALAMEALLNGSRSVADLAADIGFSEPSAFHRAFHKWTGKSPALFRREASFDADLRGDAQAN